MGNSETGSGICIAGDCYVGNLFGERQYKGATYEYYSKKLLRDYAEIKKTCPGNMVITISEAEFPKYKDTLDYLERYEYIRSIDIDNAIMYKLKCSYVFELAVT